MTDLYSGREQTAAKHFILRNYLQRLAFKILTFADIAYVDGFSGPWQARDAEFSDTSFMIAISVLRDAQQQVLNRTGIQRSVRCFFVERDPATFAKLKNLVMPHHDLSRGFEVIAHYGEFEKATDAIQAFVADSFPIYFIDPTGWTGYSFDTIGKLFVRGRCEVLINFMYEFVNRFAHSDDESIVASMAPILGGPNWRSHLDQNIPRGLAVEQLFRDTLKEAGRFKYVVSTKIDKSTAERPHFFIAYGTKNLKGLIEFRETEYAALRGHMRNRAKAKEEVRQRNTGVADLFANHHADMEEATIEELVADQIAAARSALVDRLRHRGALQFSDVVAQLLQAFMLRETNVKDICVQLSKSGQIANTWGSGGRKPKEHDLISLTKPD